MEKENKLDIIKFSDEKYQRILETAI